MAYDLLSSLTSPGNPSARTFALCSKTRHPRQGPSVRLWRLRSRPAWTTPGAL